MIVLMIYIIPRYSLILQLNRFNEQDYEDKNLILIKNLINWCTLLAPFNQIKVVGFIELVAALLSCIHWIALISVIAGNQLMKTFLNQYFTYLQLLLFYPSYIHINRLNNISSIFICLIPMIVNFILYSYIQRNYILPAMNPYSKRYKFSNYFIHFLDLVAIFTMTIFDELIHNSILTLVFFIQLVDSIYKHPYPRQINVYYCVSQSILFLSSLLKLINTDQKQFLLVMLLFLPLFTTFMKKILKLFYEQQVNQKQLLINFVDEYQCSNLFIQQQVLRQLQQISHCKHNLSTYQKHDLLQHYIETLFIKLIDDLPINEKYLDEDLHIFKILFLYQRLPNLAFIHLKKYQINTQHQSFYFQILEKVCNKTNNTINFELQQIQKSQILFDESIPKITEILQLKIQYYESLIIGFSKIEYLASLSENLSRKIIRLKNVILKKLNIHVFTIQKELQTLNILDLRLLSQFFGSILNDYHITFHIEQRVEELLNLERNIQTRKIQSQTLLNEEVVFLSISMLNNLGAITKYKQKLLKFMKFPDEDIQITHLNQILPEFLQNKHDKYLTKLIDTGDSKLIGKSHDVFPIYYSGFSFNITLQLLPSQEISNDYIITGILKKVNENTDFILFDDSGRILGVTESIQQILIEQTQTSFDSRLLKSYIYFWFKDLLYLINDQQEQLYQTHIGMQTVLIQSIDDLNGIIKNHDIFRRQHFFTQTNTHTESDSNVKVQCFEKNYIQQTSDFVSDIKINQNCPCYQVVFDVHFFKIQDSQPYFMLQISEFTQKELKTSCLGTLSAYSSIFKTRYMDTDRWVLDDDTNMDEEHQELIINQTIINKLLLRYDDKVDEMIKNNKESNLISPRSNREILIIKEDDDSEYIRESNILKSSSQRQIKEENEKFDFVQEKQSKSSVTSDKTQNSIYNLMRKLQHTQQFQTSIIKAFIITIILSIFLIIIISIELSLNREQTNTLEYEIPLVRIPQRFNRLYCTFVTIGQLELQYQLLNQSYGEYYDYRIKNESAIKRVEIQNLMTEIKNEFSSMQQNGQIPQMQIRFINEYVYQIINVTMIEFDIMVNEFTSQINQLLQGDQQFGKIQILLQFLKGNLIKQLDITIKLVDQIQNNFFATIQFCQTEWFIFLIVQLWIIIIMLILQLKYWQSPYKYMQSILLLISKINENDIEFSGSRIYCLIDKLQRNQSIGKNINYFREFFWYSKSQTKSFSLKLTEISKTRQNFTQQKARQSSRIQETSFSILSIKIILLCIWFLLSGFVLSGFLILKTNMDNSQPELKLAMEYVKFKQDLDGIMIICQLLKNQQILIDETMASGIFKQNPELNTKDKYFKTLYNELLQDFKPLITDMNSIYVNIYNQVISSSKISEYNKDLLLSYYEQNLCDLVPEILAFCAYENGKFKYFSTYPSASTFLNNKQVYKYGINGLYQQIINILDTHYTLEQNGIKDTNITNVKEFLSSSDYVQIILPYFFDLSYAILQFYYTIIQSALDILEDNYIISFQFFIIAGIGCLLILYIIIIIKAITLQNKVRLIRQTLIMIPHESLQDSTIMSAIKNIDRNL